MAAIGRADTLSHARLAKDPEDRDALFALTLTSSLQADYVALIEKRNLASLQFTKEASASAQELLVVCHDRYGALLATGFSANTALEAWPLRCAGFFGWVGFRLTSKVELQTCRPLPRTDTISPPSLQSCCRLHTCERRISLGRWSC